MTRIELSHGAESDLADITTYSVDTFGPVNAALYLRDLDRALDRLSEFPALGMVVADLDQKPRCLPCRQHRIFYRHDEDSILVIRILHHAMDPSKWLE
ncbi:MAG: type II toxin-antitoxin system RelE/ParE family toxin [Pseudomonadota bacterium]